MNFTTCSVCGADLSCVHFDPKRDAVIYPYGTFVLRGYTGADENTRLRVVNAFTQMGMQNPLTPRVPLTRPFFEEPYSIVDSPYIPAGLP